jgi:hypothetical protein
MVQVVRFIAALIRLVEAMATTKCSMGTSFFQKLHESCHTGITTIGFVTGCPVVCIWCQNAVALIGANIRGMRTTGCIVFIQEKYNVPKLTTVGIIIELFAFVLKDQHSVLADTWFAEPSNLFTTPQ